MSNLRNKLRKQAQAELALLVKEVRKEAGLMCSGKGIQTNQLLRLSMGGRVKALENKVLANMIDRAEDDLLADLDDDEELPGITAPATNGGHDMIRELAISAKANEVENLPEPLKSHVIAERKRLSEELPIG